MNKKRKVLILSFVAMFFLAVSFVAYSWMEPTKILNAKNVLTDEMYPAGGSGDLNQDGKIDIQDALIILHYLNGDIQLGSSEFTVEMRGEADVNGDGRVDTLDAVLILGMSAGKYTVEEIQLIGKQMADRTIDMDSDGNVGDVLAKNIQVEGDVCLANGKCLSGLLNRLVFGVHSENDCISGGGTVVYERGSSGMAFCKFIDSSCPFGWAQYKDWSATEESQIRSCMCEGSGCCSGQQIATRGANIDGWEDCSGHTPVFGSHAWGNTPVETTLLGARAGSCACYDCCQCSVSATVTAVGCY